MQHANDVQSAGSQGMDHLRVVHLLLELCPRAYSEPPGSGYYKPGAHSLPIVILRRQILCSLLDYSYMYHPRTVSTGWRLDAELFLRTPDVASVGSTCLLSCDGRHFQPSPRMVGPLFRLPSGWEKKGTLHEPRRTRGWPVITTCLYVASAIVTIVSALCWLPLCAHFSYVLGVCRFPQGSSINLFAPFMAAMVVLTNTAYLPYLVVSPRFLWYSRKIGCRLLSTDSWGVCLACR